MKKRILSLVLALVMVVSLFSGLAITANAEDSVYYTLDGTVTGGSNGYATVSEITQNSITWDVMGNTTTNPWRIGGKSLTNVGREAYSTTAMGSAITKVDLTIGSATATFNGIKLVVASDSAFANQIDEVTGTPGTNTTISFTPTLGNEWATGAYYKFVFNVSCGGSNQYVQFTKAEFYQGGSTPVPSCTHENATEVAAVAATCTTAGNSAYYHCPDCGKNFTDSTLATETTLADVTIDALGHNFVDGECTRCDVTQTAFALVTDAAELAVGREIIVVNLDATFALGAQSANGYYRELAAVTADQSGNILVTSDSAVEVITLGGTAGAWTLGVTGGYLYASGGNSNNNLGTEATSSIGLWTITVGDVTANNETISNVATITNNDVERCDLRYNASSTRFSCYATTTTQAHVRIYMKEVAVNPDCTHENAEEYNALAATCTTVGHTAYFYCPDCYKYFTDSTFATETTADAVAIPALGHTYGAYTSNNDGTHSRTCSVCNNVETEACTMTATANAGEFACSLCSYTTTLAQYAEVTTVTNGNNVVIYHPNSNKVLTATASGTKLAGADVPTGYYDSTNGSLYLPIEAAIMTVEDLENDQFRLSIPDGNGGKLYLTSGATGNSLSFAAAPAAGEDNYGLWTITLDESNNLYLMNVNAAYNGNHNQALEYYSGFTTYGKNTTAAYQMKLFANSHVHNYVGVVTTPATCGADGLMTYTCAGCGDSYTEVIPATGEHNYQDGFCTVCGAAEPVATDYSGTYYISVDNYYMTTDLGSAATKRYQAEAVTGTLPASITIAAADNKTFVIAKDSQTGDYVMYAPAVSGDNYLTYVDNGGNFGATAFHFDVIATEENGVTTYQLKGTDGTNDRYLSRNASQTYFGWYKDTQHHDLTLIPVTIDANAHVHSYTWDGNIGVNGQHTEACTCGDTRLVACADADPVVTPATCQAYSSTAYTCDVCGYTWTETGSEYGAHNYVNGICTVCGAAEPEAVYYEKVTSQPNDWSGDYLIVYEDESDSTVAYVFNGADETNGYVQGEIDNNRIAYASGMAVITIAPMTENYSLRINGNNYMGQTTDGNGIVINATEHGNTISIADGSAQITSSGAFLRFNASSGQYRFRYYKSSTYTAQKAVQLYKLVEETPAETHTALYFAGQAATCGADGVVAYYYCQECANDGDLHYGKMYSDAALTTEITPENAVIPATGVHNWDETETVAATCTVPGHTSYECTVCGEEKEEPIAALGHNYVWNNVVGNGEHTLECTRCHDTITATCDTNGTDGACSVCGYKEVVDYTDPELTFLNNSISLSMASYIGAQMEITPAAAAGYDSIYVVVSHDRPTGTVSQTLTDNIADGLVDTDNNQRYVFEYKLAAAMMNDNITATVYGVKNEVVYTGATFTNWTVKEGALAQLSTYYPYIKWPAYRNRCVMLVDMLNYGAASQSTFTYNADNLVNTGLDTKYVELATAATPSITNTSSVTSNGLTTATVYGNPAIGAETTIQLQVRFKMPNKTTSNYEAHISYNGKTVVVDGADFAGAGTTSYPTLVFDQLQAGQVRTPVEITIYQKSNNQPISETYTYSIESAASNMLNGNFAELMVALMKFGDATATAFAG